MGPKGVDPVSTSSQKAWSSESHRTTVSASLINKTVANLSLPTNTSAAMLATSVSLAKIS